MTRSLILLPLAFTFAACSTIKDGDETTADTAEQSSDEGSGGYSFGSSDDGDATDGTETDTACPDTGDSGDDSGTDSGTDSGDTTDVPADDGMVNARVWITPDVEWDISVEDPSTANPEFGLWPVADYSLGDWTGYGATIVDTTSSNGAVHDDTAYVLGDYIVIGGVWDDGVNPRYLTEANGVVNLQVGTDDAQWVIVEFLDDSWESTGVWQAYSVYAFDNVSEMVEGEAGWIDNGSGGGDLYVATYTITDQVGYEDAE